MLRRGSGIPDSEEEPTSSYAWISNRRGGRRLQGTWLKLQQLPMEEELELLRRARPAVANK